ncbi:MAG: hypothetical protein IKY37_04420, partial [Bacteroidaceae bacterium]|nr:hypothetical protein [Bacteroidaceae bacterium]
MTTCTKTAPALQIKHTSVACIARNNYFYKRKPLKEKSKKKKMGRKKFTQKEYNVIRKLLGSKM